MNTGNPSNIIRFLLKLGMPKVSTESQEVYDSIIEKEKESYAVNPPKVYSDKILKTIEKRRK